MYIAFHKPIFYGILEIGQYGFILVVTYLLIKFGQRISSVFIGYASFAIIGSVVSIMILRKYVFKQFSEHKFSFKTGLLKKVISFGLFMLVYNLFNLFFGKIDMVLLTVFRNLSEVGIYSVVLPTTMAISNLCSSFILVLLPVTSEMWASKLYKQLKKNIKKLYLFCLVIGLPVAISLYFYSSLIIKTLFTDKYLNGTLTLQLLSFSILLILFMRINVSLLAGMNQQKRIAKIMVLSFLVNLCFSIILIPKYGQNGAAISALLSFGFGAVSLYLYIYKKLKIILKFVTFSKIILANVFFFILVRLLSKFIFVNELMSAIFVVGVSFSAYVILVFLLKILSIKEILRSLLSLFIK